MISNKHLGLGIMILSVILLIVGGVYVYMVEGSLRSHASIGEGGECIHEGPTCPFEEINRFMLPKFIGFAFIVVLFFSGLYLFMKPEGGAKKKKKAPKDLPEDEKKVYDLIAAENGMIYQNEIVDKTELSKVKVTRVLDKLEGKELIERRRRGMTNVVILK